MKEIYFNSAATGIVKKKHIEEAHLEYLKLCQNASKFAEKWFEKNIPSIKEQISKLFNAKTSEIALIPNFSFGINVVLNALPENSNVLVYKKDYPSLVDPLQHKNFNVIEFNDKDGFEIYPETIERYIRQHYIDFLLISHIQWLTGFKANLKEIIEVCHRNDVRVIIDATQSAGANHIDFKDCEADVIIFSNYKWMNSGFGTGILLMREDFLYEFPPKISGMHSYTEENGKMKLIPCMKFYEPGHQNMFGLLMLQNTLKKRTKKKVKEIESHNRELTQYFIKNLKSDKLRLIGNKNSSNRSSIVYLNGGEEFHEYLSKKGIVTSFRGGRTRISFHQHNTVEEIDKLLKAISKF